jgi:hypothetical protein
MLLISSTAFVIVFFQNRPSQSFRALEKTYCVPRSILQSRVQGILLTLPPHTSHLLQPLDGGCYSPLKVLYGYEVFELDRQNIFHIDELDFLRIYSRIRPTVLSESNIKSEFQATTLNPFYSERVLTYLTVVRTPSSPGTTAAHRAPWTAETRRTVNQLQL